MATPRQRWIVGGVAAAVLLAAALLLGLGGERGRGTLVLSGNIESRQVQVGSKVGGRIARVFVEEGQRVRAGQVLARFESDEFDARRAEAVGNVAQLEANLQQLLAGSRPEEIARARAAARQAAENLALVRTWPRKEEVEQARADLAAAEAEFQNSDALYKRLEALFSEGAVSRQDRDNAWAKRQSDQGRMESLRERLRLLLAGSRQEEIRLAEQRYAESLANLELVEKGPRKEEIAAARAALAQARARLQAIETQLDELTVKAPSDSIVEVFDVRPGDLAGAGKPLATLVLPEMWVRVFVPESKLGRIKLGQPVAVRVDSFQSKGFAGVVEQIAAQAEFTPRNVQTPEERVNQVFSIKVRLDNPEGLLRAGMAADVVFRDPHPDVK